MRSRRPARPPLARASRPSVRTLATLGAIAAAAPLLVGCTPPAEARLGVAIDEGRLTLVVLTCEARVTALDLSQSTTAPDGTFGVPVWSGVAEVAADSLERFATPVELDRLGPDLSYHLAGETPDDGVRVVGATFTRSDLRALGPGDVYVFGSVGATGERGEAVVTEDEMVAEGCTG